MGADSIETNRIEQRLAAFATVEEPRARRESFFDALSRSGLKRILFLASDAATVALTNWVSLIVMQRLSKIPRPNMSPPGYLLFYLPFLLVVLYVAEGYASPDLRRPEKDLAIIFRAVSLSFIALVCANFIFFKELGFSRYLFVCWYCLALAIIPSFRMGLKAFYGALWRRGLAQQRVLWVGSTEKLAEFENLLSVQRYQGYRMVGVIPASELAGGSSPGAPMRTESDALAAWDEAVSKLRVQLVIMSLPSTTPGSRELVRKILRRCKVRGVDVEVYSDLSATSEFSFALDEFSGFFRFCAAPAWSQQLQRSVKFCVDIFAGLLGSLLTALVSPLVGAAIKLEDAGPIFYRSAYLGPKGQDRYYLKFRTMRVGADQFLEGNPELHKQFESQYKLRQDPRVTRVGRVLRKYSLDEFPSFFSILCGDISLVGPRTIRRKEGDRYGSRLPKLLSVKSGLTGFWQVMGRQLTTYEERIQMDMFYIDHWSIWLDLLIIAKTFWKVLGAEGAY
ncbi:MAG TPA: exopolysaccharide biosynthesis polyprenyl glycosylphosphotransferase [Terriglobia bacterium]|nr:exopolysaccharide biosynthesis polyprenyl glycosylphosphotransferase [Terriglobia bacterium]